MSVEAEVRRTATATAQAGAQAGGQGNAGPSRGGVDTRMLGRPDLFRDGEIGRR